MQLAQQLKGAGLDVFPCSVNYNTTKHRWEKQPLTVNRESWAETARRPYNDPAINWHGIQVLGVPVPAGVVIVDLDTYKGVTTDMADMVLGCPLPWAAAHIQTTISGGQHFAFRLPGWQVKQGSNLGAPGSGIDTRVAGRGFICTGGGYQPGPDNMGALRLAYPETLPVLPDGCRHVLEQVQAEVPKPVDLPHDEDRDVDTVRAALAFIDPTERDTWRDMGFALKHYFHDDEPTGYALWDSWSAGEFWAEGCPPSYHGETQPGQWNSFKAVKEGASITIGSLFHAAIKGGWIPPARFDTAAAFGANAAPVATFNALVDRILEEGSDARKTTELMDAIKASGCNEVQAILLRNELKAALKSAKILDKDLAAAIDKQTTPQTRTVESSLYAKNHTENAQLFLQTHYADGSIIRSDETWYVYDGRCWVEVEDGAIDYQLTAAMVPSRPQKSTVNGTYQMAASMVYKANANMTESPAGLIVFQNGVLNIHTGELLPHSMEYLTTKIVPYNFNPGAVAPRWLQFVNEIFEGDQERVALLQEWIGYNLSPTYEHQKVMLMLGPRRSGKGTIGNIIADLVGEMNYTGCSLASFAKDDFLDGLRNKSVAFSGDTAKNVNRAIVDQVVENIKKISGNDYVDFGRKYKSRLTCRLPTRITLAGNHVPRLFDDSEALTGRLLILPFDVSFYDREDTALLNVLRTELEGIALWALQGLARLNASGRFTIPAASRAEMDYIAETYSPLRAFLNDCCTLGDENTGISCEELYNAYKAWALATGEEKILPRKPFVSAMKDATRGHGCRYGTHRQSGGQRGFRGIHVRGVPSATAAAFKPELVK